MALHTVVETVEFIRRAKAVGMGDAERAGLVTMLAREPEACSPRTRRRIFRGPSGLNWSNFAI